MNRPIKFRVWDKRKTKGMHTQNMLYDAQLHDFWEDFVDYPGYELMQYTGLTDKNKKEIYEGDILDFTARYKQTGPVPVIYYGGSFGCVVTDDGGLKEFWNLSHIVQQYYPEIIGNIFENPELLK